MPDNWRYVFAAYGVAAVAMIGYWRYLSARARAVGRTRGGSSRQRLTASDIGRDGATTSHRTSRRP